MKDVYEKYNLFEDDEFYQIEEEEETIKIKILYKNQVVACIGYLFARNIIDSIYSMHEYEVVKQFVCGVVYKKLEELRKFVKNGG